ncbi:MAG: nucleoside triphosphate pyrophosphohydrolase family protein [Sphingobacteriaceae bacterium]|nr:nucleoside triphosphate pyrophosphohydrolase family protein [Sphingobacteriaceae bacterium]
MNIDEYVELAQRTSATKDAHPLVKMDHAQIGLTTEVGEFADPIKKAKFYNKPYDPINAAEEIGDIFWYLAEACAALKIKPSEILKRNIEKLKVRYPNKYSDYNAENRNLEKEREILEGKDNKPAIMPCKACNTINYLGCDKNVPSDTWSIVCTLCNAIGPPARLLSTAILLWDDCNK